ncbi:MAG: histone deacetylase [Deltaproteobacteria bacterium]|nr:histone deacetylase [Deltaproteobacteria bacterium]
MTKTAIFSNNLFLEHMKNFDHLESASRLRVIYDELDKPEIAAGFIFPAFQAAGAEIIKLNHQPAYIKQLADTAGQSFVSLDADTQTSAQSYDAACLAVGAAVTAARMVVAGEVDNAFCLVRPPGHHAEVDKAMGFCLFNNAALAAQFAIHELGLQRVLIVDWDLHHGNGTQHSFYDSDNVLYFSTHQYPCYPGSGAAAEVGSGRGAGYTINVPLPAGLDDLAFATIYNDLLSAVARQYQPELIIVSAGYDIHRDDPLGGMMVTEAGFAYMTKILLELAAECGSPFMACLEGGYDLNGLKNGVMATLNEMRGYSTLTDKTIMNFTMNSMPIMAMEETRSVAKKFWKL